MLVLNGYVLTFTHSSSKTGITGRPVPRIGETICTAAGERAIVEDVEHHIDGEWPVVVVARLVQSSAGTRTAMPEDGRITLIRDVLTGGDDAEDMVMSIAEILGVDLHA